jgi:hypothetical protein
MLPLYHDPYFTFHFSDDRLIRRIHLEGVEAGRQETVCRIDPDSGERLGLLATVGVGERGWVDLPEPITVRAGEAFIAMPEEAAGVGVFAVSTFDTDYLFAKEAEFPKAVTAVRMAGHSVEGVLL